MPTMLGLLSADLGALSWLLALPAGVSATHLAAPLALAVLLAAAIRLRSSDLIRMARERVSRECAEGFIAVGSDGAIVDFNPAAASLLQGAPLTTGQPVSAILHEVAEPALAACARGETWLGSVASPDGSTLATEVTSIRDANGDPLGALVVMRSCPPQGSKMPGLANGEDNFRKAFEANPFPLTITRTATSEILLANRAALDFYEIPAAELATTYLTDFYANPGQRARLISALKACGMVNDMLIAFRTRGGKTRWAVVNAFPFDFGGEPCLLSGLADITDRKRAEDALAQRARELTALHETSLIVSSQSETSTLMTTVVERTTELLGATGGGIYLLQSDQQSLALTAGSTLPIGWAGLVVALGSGLTGLAALKGTAQVVENYHEWAGKAGELSDGFAGRVLATPLKFRDRIMGVLVIAGSVPGPFTSDELQLVQLFAEQASIALENARLYSEVERLAVIDELTGFHNRRGLFAYGEREVLRSARYSRPLSAIMLDLDHFKAVNDRYGHPAGDEVLRRVAECIRARARAVDIAGRYGGEEMVLLLPETGLSGAVLIAERLRLAIADTTIETAGHTITITASFGVSTLSASTPDLAALLDRADRALYDAKESGRNRVCSARQQG